MADLPYVYSLAGLRHEAEAEAARLTSVRRLLRPLGRGTSPADALPGLDRTFPWFGKLTARRSGLRPGVYLVYRLGLKDGRGSTFDECLVTVHVEHGAPEPLGVLDLRRLVEACRAACAGVLESAARSRFRRMESRLGPSIHARLAREKAMARSMDVSPAPVQPGLFDLRALRSADAEANRRERLQAEAETRLRALGEVSRLEACEPELLLALVVGP